MGQGFRALVTRATNSILTGDNVMVLNQRFINEVAVGIIYVQGSTADLQMSSTERTQIAAEIQTGLTWMATLEPDAKISFIFDDVKSWKTVSIDAAPWQGAPWLGLPREFYQKSINAALWRKTNDKIYMFKGDQYARLTDTTMDAGYPKPIAGNWNGVPSSFEEGIDAVFMHHVTNKIYMFKGDQYIRLTDTTMDAGYPKPIKGNFKGVPEHMEDGIQAAMYRGSNDKVYLFGKHPRLTLTEYVRFSDITQT